MDWIRGLKEATYDSFASLLHLGHFRVKSAAARVVAMAYGFLVLIIINTYVANLAAFLTITQVDTMINGLQDLTKLPGKRVVSVSVYGNRLKRLGITPEIAQQTENNQDQMVEDLRAGEYKAIVMDEPWISYTANTDGCDLKMLPQTLEFFDYAFAFPKTSDDSLVKNVSEQVLALQEDGVMEDLAREHIFIRRSGCPADREISETRAVRFSQVLGLWIVLAFAILIATLLLVFPLVPRISMGDQHQHVLEGVSDTSSQRVVPTVHCLHAPSRTATVYHKYATMDLECSDDGSALSKAVRMEVREEMQGMRQDLIKLVKQMACGWRPVDSISATGLYRSISDLQTRRWARWSRCSLLGDR
ncbi:unnamed protein product [Ostreobium quekettii]|uniref:Ionotropic glutamate receptor C-terminal domain-containing protein n=1 Tax=Ostreobium quekettii TaxID=121088 RepID=A0A8S1JEG3_9CHLO|nr:unnamed protein product [Ostreobium quekettii]